MKKRNNLHSGKIATARAIAALSSPVRQEIIDTLEALGGVASVPQLATQLGRPADGLYYHVRQLTRAGVLVGDHAGRAGRYRTSAAAGTALQIDYAPDDPRSSAALRTVVGSMLRIARRDFDAGLAMPTAIVRGARRTLWAARAKGWLGAAEIVELNQLLVKIHTLMRRPPRARQSARPQLVSMCFVVAPIAARPARRR